jgi:signal recognition particle subunit SEC65
MSFMFNLSEYQTCAERLELFWKEHPDGRIDTKLVEASSSRFIVQAYIYRTEVDQHPWASGLAEETISGRGVNATSALENAETSALARALANAGYSPKGDPSKRASREEMNKVAAKANNETLVQQTKAKMAETAKEYVPVPKEEDPWTMQVAAPVQTMEEAVSMVKDVLGGTPTDESCIHGARVWKTGTSKAGKQYGMWRCPESSTRDMPGGKVPCDPIWYEIAKDGTWKPQVKRG